MYVTFQEWKKYFNRLQKDMKNFKGTKKEKYAYFKPRIDKSWKMYQEVIFGRMKDLGVKLSD